MYIPGATAKSPGRATCPPRANRRSIFITICGSGHRPGILTILDTFPNYHVDFGSVTDVAILAEESNICCFNLSVGYYKQHSEREFTIVRDVERAEKFLLNLPGEFWGKQYLVDYIFQDDLIWDYDNYHDTFSDFLKPGPFKKGGSHAK